MTARERAAFDVIHSICQEMDGNVIVAEYLKGLLRKTSISP